MPARVGAIGEVEDIDKLMAAIADPDTVVVTQIAPAVRLALGEEIGMDTGELPMEVFVAGLKQIGFDHVLHTNFTADLTILEEGNELLSRVKNGGTLPMFTSCSPGWINFCETFYPDLLDNLSTCKSPQQMFGALVKTYWADKMDIPAKKIFSVSIMPCVAKKFEAARPEMNASGFQDVDIVLTTREIGRLFRMSGIDFKKLAPAPFSPWMGEYTGAAVIFGATGGVMEAALRLTIRSFGGVVSFFFFFLFLLAQLVLLHLRVRPTQAVMSSSVLLSAMKRAAFTSAAGPGYLGQSIVEKMRNRLRNQYSQWLCQSLAFVSVTGGFPFGGRFMAFEVRFYHLHPLEEGVEVNYQIADYR